MVLNEAFENATRVTPLDSHRYAADLEDEWCVGTVPHGGYTTSILYRLAVTHFAHTHPKHYPDPATPISMQLAFLRRTGVGPAELHVEDSKLGARTSTLRVSLLQPNEKTKNLEVKVTGYITVSPASAEVGVTANKTTWELHPLPAGGSASDGRVDLQALAETNADGPWKKVPVVATKSKAMPRKASRHLDMYTPKSGEQPIDQWARFRPGGSYGRWTNEGVVFLVDMYPQVLYGFDRVAARASGDTNWEELLGKFWYPTVTLNVDIKKRLPAEGVEWLYSRVVSKAIRNGRMDVEVTVLDEEGDVVAVGSQVALVLSASRNQGQRQKKL